MALTRLLGVLGVLCVVGLVLGAVTGVYGLFSGDYVTAAGSTLGLVVVIAGSGIVVGRRTGRWTDNPYW